ncbi:hypothetical protein [Fictibacillus arsenicus]|uniref:hypothetical protein n=1 Tax=Fictibacillus arsenicus TaxID=255247 RepID=UPI000A84487C|nr:hypothetical protein [Fictibacillus arsenicus]
MLKAFPIIDTMMDKDHDLAAELKNYPKTEVVVIGYGEEKEFNVQDSKIKI